MSTSSTWNYKVGGLVALSVILAVIVAVQGSILYRDAQQNHARQQEVAVAAPSVKLQIPKLNPIGPSVWIGASPSLWNVMPSLSNDPFDQMAQFNNRMDQAFADAFAQPQLGGGISDNLSLTVPSMDLRNQKDLYTVQMNMPGVDKNSIKVNVDGRLLSVSGQREINNQTTNNKVISSEHGAAQFESAITLPTPVKAAGVKAEYAKGVLTIHLPKSGKTTEATSVTVT